ncbi:hypothetical protein ARMGADRAFT_813254 [Armillaria gallica]|uniref:NACHT domain-containing protein n=1 Tax=Armillaria gallica TaxID=47427 RepID=A0A2H3CDR7_ARMGA|nr:hypothetical protein ARMGADRAFT_813254 [Armillaria gallica]
MAEALGIASSIITLIEISHTIVGYLKDIREAPKERDKLSKELSYLELYLGMVNQLTQMADANDPWLATAQRLSGPFAQLDVLLKGLKKTLEPASDGIGKMKQRLLWKFSKESVEDALKKIERIKSLIIVAVQLDHAALSRAMNETLAIVDTKVDNISDTTEHIKDNVNLVGRNVVKVDDKVTHMDGEISQFHSQMQRDQDDGLLMTVIAWLTDLNFKSVQAEKLSQRVGDTGCWFLESKLFKEWVDGMAPSLCLWCPGNPGVGKTILAAIVIDYLRSLNHERKTLVLSIFCDYQSATAQTIPNLLCSLLKQLVQDSGLSDPVKSLYDQCRRNGTRPSLNVLTKILLQEFKSFHHVYIVLDALDECTDDKRKGLIKRISSLGDNIYLLVTSRQFSDIEQLFKKDTRLDILATDADIFTLVMDRLSRGNLANLVNGYDNLREAILTGVTEKAKGMFLLASLHVDTLTQSTNRKILRDALKELPENMTNAYDETLERVYHQTKYKSALANRIFGWIVFARRPLDVLELQHALAVEQGTTTLDSENLCSKELLGSVCGGLVIIDQMQRAEMHRDPIVRFVHYTTQEYFMSRKDKLFPDLQETIMHTCLTYLLFNSNSLDPLSMDYKGSDYNSNDYHPNIPYGDEYGYSRIPYDLTRMFPFLSYSLVHWAYYASEIQHSMGHEIITFLDSVCCSKVTKIFHAVKYLKLPTFVPVPLHFAVEYGLLHITELLLERGDDPCQCKPPLLLTALEKGKLDIVKLLLDQDKIDSNTGHWLLPLYSACCRDTQIVEMFLQSDRINVNCKDYLGCTSLMLTVASGNISSTKALLKHPGIDVLAKDNFGTTVYARAFQQYQREPDYSDDNGLVALLEKYGGRPQTDYKPTYLTATCLSNEQLNSNSGFRIPLDLSTTFPAEDLTGTPPCYNTNGDPIYIGSAIFRRSVLPCKIEPHLPVPCLVPFHGCEIAHMGHYDLLPFNSNTMEFVCMSGRHFPAGRKLVKGGHDQDGTPLYHGMAIYNGIKIPGKVSHPWTGCNITWGGTEHLSRFDYEILCWKQ